MLTHCPGRDTADTAVLVIKQLYAEIKWQDRPMQKVKLPHTQNFVLI